MMIPTRIPIPSRLVEARQLANDARTAGERGEPKRPGALFARARAPVATGPRDILFADLLRWKGTIHRDRGETYLAQQHYDRSLEIATACGFPTARGHALNCLGITAQRRGDMEPAEHYYD